MFSAPNPSPLHPRTFLGQPGIGVSGIALASLLDQHGLLAAEKESSSSAEKKPHFPAKAKRVLHIFCVGAVSHLDTFDYKPELIKRDGQPLPGVDKLVTFQGENGALARPQWEFKPRGKSGKQV